MTQYQRIGRLLTRKRGCTAMEMTAAAGTVSCHSRMAEMKRHGWTIWREAIPGRNYGRYFGKAPR